MANPSLTKITSRAEQLYDVRQLIAQKEAEFKEELDIYKNKRDALQEQLINDLNMVGLKSIKTKDGETYTKASKAGIAVTNEVLAHQWALENKAIKVDLTVAAQIIKEMKEVPKGFQKVETEFIRVTKAK